MKRLRQQGPHKIDETDYRNHCVSVRFNDAELAILESKRGKYAKGEWLRMSCLDKLPPVLQVRDVELYNSLNKTLGAIGAIVKTDRNLTQEQAQNLEELKNLIYDFQGSIIKGGRK